MLEDFAKKCVTVLIIVLMLFECTDFSLRLSCLMTFLNLSSAQDHKDDYYNKLIDCLSSCITLSCSVKGIDFLLCSIFFEFTLFYNFIRAHLSDVTKAIKSLKNDLQILTLLIIKKYLRISSL